MSATAKRSGGTEPLVASAAVNDVEAQVPLPVNAAEIPVSRSTATVSEDRIVSPAGALPFTGTARKANRFDGWHRRQLRHRRWPHRTTYVNESEPV